MENKEISFETITIEDFETAITNTIEVDDVNGTVDIEEAAKKCFELAEAKVKQDLEITQYEIEVLIAFVQSVNESGNVLNSHQMEKVRAILSNHHK